MEHLTDITVDDIQQALDSTDEKTPALRLVAAITYKNGIRQSELAEWFGVERMTIYNWLTRPEERDLDDAIRDEHRAGRPRKLDENQLNDFRTNLQNQPPEAGLDAQAWTTNLLQQFIREEFDIGYSRPSCRRLMKQAGLSYQTPQKPPPRPTRKSAKRSNRS